MKGLAFFVGCALVMPLFAQGQTFPLPITDYHYHVVKDGPSAETALAFQRKSGVRCGVLENVGRNKGWVIHSNEDLRTFIETVEKTVRAQKKDEPRLLIGLQVNDRDWYQKIDLKLYRRIDYVLADTMYYTDKSGKQYGLWSFGKDYKTDLQLWMEEYFAYTMAMLDEPIDIFANPTYLPAFAADRYDALWTEERMKAVIRKAVANNIAFEIQAGSVFPKESFIALALKMGAKFTFGSNSWNGAPVDYSRWSDVIARFNLKEENLWSCNAR